MNHKNTFSIVSKVWPSVIPSGTLVWTPEWSGQVMDII